MRFTLGLLLLLTNLQRTLADDVTLNKAAAPDDFDAQIQTETREEDKDPLSDDGELDLSTLNTDDIPSIDLNNKSVDKSKYSTKLDLTPAEINAKSDDELYELFYQNSQDNDGWVKETYRKLIDKMDKPDISDVELKILFKKRDMMEKRLEELDVNRKKKADEYVKRMRKRAERRRVKDEL
ncbi:hypothetical protein ACHAXN_009694 [Cyclotella atomus]